MWNAGVHSTKTANRVSSQPAPNRARVLGRRSAFIFGAALANRSSLDFFVCTEQHVSSPSSVPPGTVVQIDLNSVSEIDSGYVQEAARRLGSRCARLCAHSRATHVRNFSNTGGLSAPPGVSSTVPNFVPSTNPDGVGLNSVSCNASRCCTSLLLLSALGAHSVQVVDSPLVRNSKSAEVHPSWGFNSPSRHHDPTHSAGTS